MNALAAFLKRFGRARKSVTELVWVGPQGQVYPTISDRSHPLAFSINGWVYACVMEIASAVASAPLRVERCRGGVWEPVADHPLARLLEYVNADDNTYSLMEQTAAWLALYGNAFWRLVPPRGRSGGPPAAIQVLRADRVTIRAGQGKRSGRVAGYVYDTGSGESAHYDDTEVIHFRFFAPVDPHYGQSPIKALEQVINTYTAAARFNCAFLRGGGVPAAVISAESHLSEEEIRHYQALWDQWTVRNADQRRPLVMGRGMKLDVHGVSPDEVVVQTLPRMLREEICAVMRVPPALVGIYEYASYANVREQRKIFYSGPVSQYWRRIEGPITEELAPRFSDGPLRVVADSSMIAALQPDYNELANAAVALVKEGIFWPDEARELIFRMQPMGGARGRTWYGPRSTVPLATADDGDMEQDGQDGTG